MVGTTAVIRRFSKSHTSNINRLRHHETQKSPKATTASYNDTLNGEGGSDLFSVQNTAHWYNSYSDLPGGSATLEAGVANAFIGLTNFAPGNGVTTIDTNGYAGVEIGGNGSSGKLDLSGVTIDGGSPDTATILANQSYQTVTGPKQNETFDVASYNDTLNGEGGSDLFSVQNTSHWYNSYSDLPGGSATLEAGVANAFIGLTNFAPATASRRSTRTAMPASRSAATEAAASSTCRA